MNNEITLLNQDKTTHRVIDLDSMSTEGAKNKIINGRFRIDQEGNIGNSVTTASGVYYYADQWFAYCTATGASIKPTQTNGTGVKIEVDTGGVPSDFTATKQVQPAVQYIEAQNIYFLNNKKATVSFKFASNVNGIYSVSFANQVLNKSYVTDVSYSGNGAEVTMSVQVPFETTTVSANDNTSGLTIRIGAYNEADYETSTTDEWVTGTFVCSTSSINWTAIEGNWIYVDELQLEAGEVATAYEHIDYGTELLRCKRYFERIDAPEISKVIGIFTAYNQFTVYSNIDCVKKRGVLTVLPLTATDYRIYGNNAFQVATDTVISYELTDGFTLGLSGTYIQGDSYYGLLLQGKYIDLDARL